MKRKREEEKGREERQKRRKESDEESDDSWERKKEKRERREKKERKRERRKKKERKKEEERRKRKEKKLKREKESSSSEESEKEDKYSHHQKHHQKQQEKERREEKEKREKERRQEEREEREEEEREEQPIKDVRVQHGPALPPSMIAAMTQQQSSSSSSDPPKRAIGPSLEDRPDQTTTTTTNEKEREERERERVMVGPLCPSQVSEQTSLWAENRLKDKRDRIEDEKEKKRGREEWMTSLPSLDRRNPLGEIMSGGAKKTFSNRAGPVEQDQSWSATPGESSSLSVQDEAEAFKKQVRDAFRKETAVVEARGKSLLEEHTKTQKKEKETEKEKPHMRFSGHWDRERDVVSKSLTKSQVDKFVNKSTNWSSKFTAGSG